MSQLPRFWNVSPRRTMKPYAPDRATERFHLALAFAIGASAVGLAVYVWWRLQLSEAVLAALSVTIFASYPLAMFVWTRRKRHRAEAAVAKYNQTIDRIAERLADPNGS